MNVGATESKELVAEGSMEIVAREEFFSFLDEEQSDPALSRRGFPGATRFFCCAGPSQAMPDRTTT
jgi:hypothetical protein